MLLEKTVELAGASEYRTNLLQIFSSLSIGLITYQSATKFYILCEVYTYKLYILCGVCFKMGKHSNDLELLSIPVSSLPRSKQSRAETRQVTFLGKGKKIRKNLF